MKIVLNITNKALKRFVKSIKETNSEVKSIKHPLLLLETLLTQDVVANLDFWVSKQILDGGGNCLVGDVLSDKDAKKCGIVIEFDDNDD
jgi:hypothetical protein